MFEQNKTLNQMTTNCINPKSSLNDLFSLEAASSRVCKGNSACKNLILGGVLCDKCELVWKTGASSSENEKSFYNKFCELRAKNFPDGKSAYLVLQGIRNRLRFKIKLSFATVKSNGHLFFNGRLDRAQFSGLDFIALRIKNDHLVFSYSLGETATNEIVMDKLSVSDGKWRTVTIEYANRNVSLSLDNDDLDNVDACELARNSDKTRESSECVRVSSYYNLPAKCRNQIETCFRYFDLNGPFVLGKAPESSSKKAEPNNGYEGCISDVYLNERLINLQEDALYEHETRAGCLPKVDACQTDSDLKTKCSKCKHIWSSKVKCECKGDDYDSTAQPICANKSSLESVSLNGDGFIQLESSAFKDSNMNIKFSIRAASSFNTSLNMTLAYFKIFNKLNAQKNEAKYFYLVYASVTRTINLVNAKDPKEFVLLMSTNNQIEDGFWNTIEIEFGVAGSISLKLNDVFVQKSSNSVFEFAQSDTFLDLFIGGNPEPHQMLGFSGCVRSIQQNGVVLSSFESTNATKGCSIPTQIASTKCADCDAQQICGTNSPCFNNGTCTVSPSRGELACQCPAGFKGKYCQYETRSSRRILDDKSNCPAKWWGKEPGICGPCECDQSKNFSPDCNKTTGACSCKPKFYRQINPSTNEERCVPCDCYLEGSTSLQCEPLTGQCSCIKGAGITGRRCDQCVSPLAEMTSKGNECRQLSSSECPKAFAYNIWWPRAAFDSIANASCPKGSVGTAFRSCAESTGWRNDVDLSDCQSLRLIDDSQLLKWSQELNANQSQLNSYQAFKLVEDLNRVTMEDDADSSQPSTSVNSLYARDLLVVRNLTEQILNYEIENAPSFLFIQDKYFLTNLFSTLSRMLDKRHELKLYQLAKRLEESSKAASHNQLAEILVLLDKYIKVIVENNNQENSLSDDELELDLANFQLYLKTMQSQSFADSLSNVKFKLLTTQAGAQKVAFVSLSGASSNFFCKYCYACNVNRF
jgi:cadherin EGF LAG seven-pass G-type receptor 1